MTRKEIKEWGQHIADKVFHLKHKEMKINGVVYMNNHVPSVDVNRDELYDSLVKAGFEEGDVVEIIIKKS